MTGLEFAVALKPLLEARAGLNGVTVHITEPEERSHPEIILIRGRVRQEITWDTFGPERTDDGTIPGRVWTWAADAADAADQALQIVSEIAAQVLDAPPQVGERTRGRGNVPTVEWMPVPADNGGWYCDAQFDLTYTAELDS